MNNLDPEIYANVQLDLSTAQRLAIAQGQPFPPLNLRLLALDREHDSSLLPKHSLTCPKPSPPEDLNTRCEWQKQRDSFEIVEQQNEIWIIGGSSIGVMYGVNEVIGCKTGLIWSSQNEDDSVFGPLRDLPPGPQIPRIAYRGIYNGNPDWFGRQRLNFRMLGAKGWINYSDERWTEMLSVARNRGIYPTLSEHAMDTFLPVETLQQHPEWMGLRDGQRVLKGSVVMPDCPHLNATVWIQPCYSNPEVRDFITSSMAALREARPEIDFFGIWPHDGVNNWCQCDACQATSPFEHMYTLAQELEAKLKTPVIRELIAYSNMLNVPQAPLPPSTNTYAFFCAYLRGFKHRIFDAGGPERVMTGVDYPDPDRINPVDEREYGQIFKNWLPYWREANIMPAVFEYIGTFPDETGRMDHQRYHHIPPPQLREDEAVWYAEHGVGLAILCGNEGHGGWPDAFPDLAWAHSLWGNEPMPSLRHRYYTALGGKYGNQLADAVDNVSSALKTSDAIPEQALNDLEAVLQLLPDSSQVVRYRDWMGFIRLGRKAWSLLLGGDLTAAADAEGEIRRFVEARADRIPVANLILSRSLHYEARARELAAGRPGTNYAL